MAKTLLIIGAGVEQVKAYQLARMRGLFVVGTDMNADAPAFEFADDRIMASTRDPFATLTAVTEYIKKRPVHGVMTIANDVPLTVATVAKALGLPGISLEAAKLASDKLAMKKCFSSAGVGVPEFHAVNSLDDLRLAVDKTGLPLVLKPIDGRGARGVLKITGGVDLEWAWRESMSFSDLKRGMVERFVPGPQISTESIMLKGRCITPAYSDRNYEFMERYSPYIIEDGGTMPALLTGAQRASINCLVEKGALAMGIKDGIVKGDIVMGPDGPVIIELAARLSGGYYASDQIPASTGVDLITQAVKLAVGEDVDGDDCVPRCTRGAAIRFFFPPEGTITEITGADRLSRLPGVFKYALYRKPGDRQKPIKAHPDRAGFVIADGESRDEALMRAEEAIRLVEFRVA